MKKIVAVVASNNKSSITKELLEQINKNLNEEYEMEIIFLANEGISYCEGCCNCFRYGACKLDKNDSMEKIKKKLLEGDYIILASPVYLNDYTGIMKSLIDRLSYWCHLLRLAGKLGFVIAVTGRSGGDEVASYLEYFATSLGIKVIGKYSYVTPQKKVEERALEISEDMKHSIEMNFGKSNKILEKYFKAYRELYATGEDLEFNEYRFWSSEDVKKIENFQEFAANRNSLE